MEPPQSESQLPLGDAEGKKVLKRRWILLILFASMNFFETVVISLQAPFYPVEAEKKGATPTEYGFVFGIPEFMIFLLHKLGPKLVFNVCVGITALSVIFFGLLDRIDDHTAFISLSFFCRFIEGVGAGGFLPATFAIISIAFPDSVATTFASLETFAGLGLLVGPALGGLLFTLGGYTLPFVSVGGILLLAALFSYVLIPNNLQSEGSEGTEKPDFGIMTLLKIPSIGLCALSVVLVSFGSGFLFATLEPHVRQFQLTPLETSSLFVVNGGIYTITAPIWGHICDRLKTPIYVNILGCLFCFMGFLLIGPVSFMPFDTTLWITIIGLALEGLGFACCLISAFVVARKVTMERGYADNIQTNGVISGLWQSSISLGAFVGPPVSGVLFDYVGFKSGSWVPLIASAAVGLAITVHTITDSPSSLATSSSPESQPLLAPSGAGEDSKSTSGTELKSYGSTSD